MRGHVLSAEASKYPGCPKQLSIDPYVGCDHDCLYCIAIHNQEETASLVKPREDILSRLEEELAIRDQHGMPKLPVYVSPWTDAYQPLEEKLEITREILKVLIRNGYPFFIITKSTLVTRDLDLLTQDGVKCNVCFSLITPNDDTRKRFEPGTASVKERLEAIQDVSRAGIRTIVKIDPVIPTITDKEADLDTLLKSVADSGASHITAEILRLTPNIAKVLHERGLLPEEQENFQRMYDMTNKAENESTYIDPVHKESILQLIWFICQRYGLSFTTCVQTSKLRFSKGVCTGVDFTK